MEENQTVKFCTISDARTASPAFFYQRLPVRNTVKAKGVESDA